MQREPVSSRAPGEGASFVMRLWLESREPQPTEWRWHVTHIQSGSEKYFRSLDDVMEFVAACAGAPAPSGSPHDPRDARGH